MKVYNEIINLTDIEKWIGLRHIIVEIYPFINVPRVLSNEELSAEVDTPRHDVPNNVESPPMV